jgi:hypothetical protein
LKQILKNHFDKRDDEQKDVLNFAENVIAIHKAMDCEFKSGRFFSLFENYMKNCVAKWTINEIYAPIGSIIQSSGNGKTK